MTVSADTIRSGVDTEKLLATPDLISPRLTIAVGLIPTSAPREAARGHAPPSSLTKPTRRTAMPLINVKLIEDVFTSEQKGQIVERLTDAMVSIEGENMRGVTWVVVEEVQSGDWGIGGQPLSTEAVKALAAGAPA